MAIGNIECGQLCAGITRPQGFDEARSATGEARRLMASKLLTLNGGIGISYNGWVSAVGVSVTRGGPLCRGRIHYTLSKCNEHGIPASRRRNTGVGALCIRLCLTVCGAEFYPSLQWEIGNGPYGDTCKRLLLKRDINMARSVSSLY